MLAKVAALCDDAVCLFIRVSFYLLPETCAQKRDFFKN